MDLQVTLTGRGKLAAQIYRQLLDAVLDGRLQPGERLPPTRELARRLDVSRNTVSTAYDRLTAEGVLVGRAGAGSFVSDAPLSVVRPRSAPAGPGVWPRRLWRVMTTGTRAEPDALARAKLAEPAEPAARLAPDEPAYDFRVGMPDPALFPLETWRRLVARELRRTTIASASYAAPAGHPLLRPAIARYVGLSRAVRADADDVIVTSGAQQALDLVGRVLIEPGCCVAMEEPGYPPARHLFHSLGARVVGVPVDDEGLVVTALPAEARLVYTTPSHQFPLGTPMSLARRAALLDWAERRGVVIVEDDYDSEFRFSDRPLAPLQSLDRQGRVIYVGSFSKTLLPMLRLGFLVAPRSLRSALIAARQLSDWHGDQVTQGALAQFMVEGLLSRHIRRATREYAERRALIVARLADDFADWLAPVPSIAGLHLAAHLVPGASVDVPWLVGAARERGVVVEDLGRYSFGGPTRPGLVIGFGRIPPTRIDPGLNVLAETFRAGP